MACTLYYGDEPYCIDVAIAKACNGVDPFFVGTFNDVTEEVYTMAETKPFLAAKQVVILRLEKLPAGAEADKFVKLIKTLPEFTEMIIVSKTVLKNSKVYKELAEHGMVKITDKLTSEKLQQTLMLWAKKCGAVLTENVAQRLIDVSGYLVDDTVTLYSMKGYIKQLSFAGDVITTEDIMALVPQNETAQVWDLSKAMLKKDKKQTLKLVKTLLEKKQDAIGMLSYMQSIFRLAYKAHLLPGNEQAKAKVLGVQPFRLYGLSVLAPDVCVRCMDVLQDAVNAIKGGAKADVITVVTLAEVLSYMGA